MSGNLSVKGVATPNADIVSNIQKNLQELKASGFDINVNAALKTLTDNTYDENDQRVLAKLNEENSNLSEMLRKALITAGMAILGSILGEHFEDGGEGAGLVIGGALGYEFAASSGDSGRIQNIQRQFNKLWADRI